MIWPILAISLYLIITAAALAVIASEDKRGKDAYYDIRNIGTALFWWVVLILAGMTWVFGKIIKKQDNGKVDK